jgi:hypothetical protein
MLLLLLLLLLTARPIQGGLTADGHQLALGLPHGDQGLLALRDLMLPHGVVTGEVPRVDAGEVGRLQAAGLAVAVREQARAVGSGHQVAQIIRWQRRGVHSGRRGRRRARVCGGGGQQVPCTHENTDITGGPPASHSDGPGSRPGQVIKSCGICGGRSATG